MATAVELEPCRLPSLTAAIEHSITVWRRDLAHHTSAELIIIPYKSYSYILVTAGPYGVPLTGSKKCLASPSLLG